MGSKIGLILSLGFSILVFILFCDLISLQANYTNLESVASSVALIISKKGGSGVDEVNHYLTTLNNVEIKYNDETFTVGDFTSFEVYKDFSSVFLFREGIKIKVSRTVMVGSYEKDY